MPTPLTFNWSAFTGDISGGVTQDTGGINVGISYFNDGNGNTSQISNSGQYVDTAAGETFAANSSLQLGGTGGVGDTSVTTVDFSAVSGSGFSEEVESVSFRINDFDTGSWVDVVTVRAYDANGDLINVDLTWNGNSFSGTNATVTSNVANGSATTQTGSILVEIAGPVSYIEIDYNNNGTGGQALWVSDIHFDAIDLDGTVEGSTGDDVIDGSYILDPDGDKVDAGDEILPGYGADGDLIEAYGGNDTVLAGAGDDSVYAGTGDDSVSGGAGNDTVFLEDGNDTFGDWSTDDGNDTVYGGAGNDTINSGNDNDELYGGADDDTLIGASGDDSMYGGTGNDVFQITDDHESDIIEGGEDVGDGDIDLVNFSNFESTQGVTVSATGDEEGTYDFDGTVGNGSYTEIEGFNGTQYDDTFNLATDDSGTSVAAGAGDDVINTGDGNDVIDGGQGADTFNAGAGNDQINLGEDSPGNPDQDPDIVVLGDGFGDDIVTNFDAPTPNGDGTYTGIDTLDVSGLFDLPPGDPDRTPVLTNDVTVTDDGSGNALLTFPNGETLTLVGISPADADNPFYLNAIGIPMPDGTVEGTGGADTIDVGYTGDPDGDMVDAGDAILAGDTNNDDLIYGYGGNDTIFSGNGADEVYGGTGNDTILSTGTPGDANTLSGDAGDDTILGGAGNDTMLGGIGDDSFVTAGGNADTITGGEDAGDGDTDTLTFVQETFTDAGVDVTMTGDEAGTYTYVPEGGTGTGSFSEIEAIELTDQNDEFNGLAATGGSTVDGGAGDDVLVGSSGSDSFIGGTGSDTLNANAGDDELDGGAGHDTIFGDEGEDVIVGGADNDALYGGQDNDTIDGGTGADTIVGGSGDDTLEGGDGSDTIIGGADQDVIYGGAGDVINGSESGVDNDTLIVSGVDYIDYDTNPENGIVYFESGGSLTFSNIENVIVSDRDGTVSGTIGDDLIDASYVGDPDGDQVDDTDAILVGHEPNDDLIEAGGGNDTVVAGAGDDSIFAGTGNDTVIAGDGEDTIFGEAGEDLISGEAGNDTVFGGAGDDILNGGTEDDALYGGDDADTFVLESGFGSDVIEGGEGGADNDTVHATQNVDTTVTATGNEAGTITDGTSTATFSEIEVIETEGGNDTIDLGADSFGMTVDSGAGMDTITGGTGDDVLSGGADQDTFLIEDGFGTDTVIGGQTGTNYDTLDLSGLSNPVTVVFTGPGAGTVTDDVTGDVLTFSEIEFLITTNQADTVDATLDDGYTYVNTLDGADTYTGSDGDDIVDDELGTPNGEGSDTFFGGAGNDEIWAGTDDDTLFGGTGSDTLIGQEGDDTITFSEGDTADGGEGDDLFVLEDLGEPSNGTITVDGGSGDETGGDTLQLGNLGVLTQDVIDSFVDDGTGSFSGSITLDDGTILNFSEIENIICFTPGTRVATPLGLVAIEDLEVGDLVVTRDHGLQPIRWIEGRTVPAVERFAPVRIRPNVLAGQDRDLLVSPQHRVLFQGYRAELLFGESEVLVAAKHLIDGMDVTQVESDTVTYVHMLFDQHEIIYAEGAATESFHPGDIGFTAVSDAAREELFAIFPELRADPNQYGNTARRCLKPHEAKLIRS